MEHLYTAQITLGVLTSTVNGNVQYELGIAHAYTANLSAGFDCRERLQTTI